MLLPSSPRLRREGPEVFLQASFSDSSTMAWGSGQGQYLHSWVGVMPSPFHLLLHLGALSLTEGLCHWQVPCSPCVPTLLSLPVVSVVWKKQDKWSLFAREKVLFEK